MLSLLFRFSFRRATILSSKMVLLHLFLTSSKSPGEFYLEILWLMLITALPRVVFYEISKLSHTVCCFLSSQKQMIKIWQSCKLALLLAFQMQRKSLCQQRNTLLAVPASHLLALTWKLIQKNCVFWFSIRTLYMQRISVCFKQFSNLRKDCIFCIFVLFKKNYSTSTLFIKCFWYDGHKSFMLLSNFLSRGCCCLRMPTRENLPDIGQSS